jgi:NitT/TauT family transport system permease protein
VTPEVVATFGVLLFDMRKSVFMIQRSAIGPRLLPSTAVRRPGAAAADQPSVPSSPRQRRQTPKQATTLLISSVVLLALWQTLVTLTEYPAWLLPGPQDVLARFMEALADGSLQQHVLPTFIESIGGFSLALLVGSILGYTVAHSRTIERWIAPYIAAVQAIPVIAVAPLIIIWFGYSSDIIRNVIVAAIVVFFPIFSSTVTAVRDIPRELREVGQVEGATRWQRLRYIELPLALPVLFTGFRTSLAYATTGAVVGEFIGSRYGLGALINVARGFFDTPLIFVALICLGGITLLFYTMLIALERLLMPWREQI